jgi:hypothetical protein
MTVMLKSSAKKLGENHPWPQGKRPPNPPPPPPLKSADKQQAATVHRHEVLTSRIVDE